MRNDLQIACHSTTCSRYLIHLHRAIPPKELDQTDETPMLLEVLIAVAIPNYSWLEVGTMPVVKWHDCSPNLLVRSELKKINFLKR